MVVNIVRMDHTLQVPASFLRPPFQPLMHDHIMKYKVEYPVTKDAEADRQHIRIVLDLREIVKERDRGNTEYDGKQVVPLEFMIVNGVVRLVPAPENAVHDVLMREPCHPFPQEKCADDYQRAKYDLTIVHDVLLALSMRQVH